eukprot:762961-Hanusia_phi.AAC.15
MLSEADAAIGSYSGEHASGMRHGRGKMQYSNGWRYEGEYAAGYKHGDGRRSFRKMGCVHGAV